MDRSAIQITTSSEPATAGSEARARVNPNGFVAAVTAAVRADSDNWEANYYHANNWSRFAQNVYLETRSSALGPEWSELQGWVLRMQRQPARRENGKFMTPGKVCTAGGNTIGRIVAVARYGGRKFFFLPHVTGRRSSRKTYTTPDACVPRWARALAKGGAR